MTFSHGAKSFGARVFYDCEFYTCFEYGFIKNECLNLRMIIMLFGAASLYGFLINTISDVELTVAIIVWIIDCHSFELLEPNNMDNYHNYSTCRKLEGYNREGAVVFADYTQLSSTRFSATPFLRTLINWKTRGSNLTCYISFFLSFCPFLSWVYINLVQYTDI